jgi:hypothetical protein
MKTYHLSFQARMERAGRSRSLVDLSCSGEETSPASSTPVNHQSLLDFRTNTLHAEENLLDAGSPASPGCNTECDPTLLDNDSDSPETGNAVGDNAEDVNMIIDNVIIDQPYSNVDPLYHQCKTARRMAYVERLVSVTNNGTFGTIIISPSSQIGHLTDHDNLENMFHGSRIQKGNVTVNQSVSMSLTLRTCPASHANLSTKSWRVAQSRSFFRIKIVSQTLKVQMARASRWSGRRTLHSRTCSTCRVRFLRTTKYRKEASSCMAPPLTCHE